MKSTIDIEEVVFRFVRPSDIKQIISLFADAYIGRNLSSQYYQWQFINTPVMPRSSAVAELNGRIVAHAGYTARRATVAGNNSVIFIKQTSMSSSTVRGTGIYSRLLSWAHGELRKRGGKIVLSYPNNNNHPIQIMRNDYFDIYQVPMLIRQSKNTDRLPEKRIFQKISSFDSEYDSIVDKWCEGSRYAILRTSEYLNWRYTLRPDITYHLIEENFADGALRSAIIWKYYPADDPDRIMVVEWFTHPEDSDGANIFYPLEEISNDCGMPIYIWQNVFDRFRYKLLEKRGFRVGEPIFYFGAFPLIENDQTDSMRHFRYWYVSMGDVDIF